MREVTGVVITNLVPLGQGQVPVKPFREPRKPGRKPGLDAAALWRTLSSRVRAAMSAGASNAVTAHALPVF